MNLLDRAYGRLVDCCGAAAGLIFGLLAVLITVDVGVRNLGVASLPWIVEVSEYCLPGATFLAAPWVLYHGGHVRVEIVLTALPRRLARLVDRLADAVGLAICVVFLHYGIKVALDSWRIDSLIIKTLVFPEWWTLAPIPFTSALLAVGFARRLAGR
ncbi:MAG: TRAP transporter small permease [Proteobacteria bacterium]|nr:TRAP transporter small permease [Pseudomonadota bacterium]